MIFTDEQKEWLEHVLAELLVDLPYTTHYGRLHNIHESFAHADEEMSKRKVVSAEGVMVLAGDKLDELLSEVSKRKPAAPAATNLGDSSSKLGDDKAHSPVGWGDPNLDGTGIGVDDPTLAPSSDQALIDEARQFVAPDIDYAIDPDDPRNILKKLIDLSERQARELADMKHDLTRHIDIACKEAERAEALAEQVAAQRKLLERVVDHLDCPCCGALRREIEASLK